MFDTVVLKARPIHLDSEVLLSMKNCKSVTFLNKETGVLQTRYEIYDEKLSYIKYLDGSQTLSIQVSIPKLLYGNNVTLTTEHDIPSFFESVQQRIHQLFSIVIPHSEWSISRADICWNFQVGKNVGEYVRMLSKQKLAFKNTRSYNQDQTVEFSNKSSRIIFYDKQQQVQKEKASPELVEQSKGVLRLEIKPSNNDIKKFSPTKNAVELLDKAFFDYMMAKVLNEIEYPSTVSIMDLSWLTLLGFQVMNSMFEESVLRQIYTSSTYANRKNLVKKMTIPKGNCLEPLAINQ
ncbi:hypothetical protein I6N90_18890 [Paenibacillus sp. GSMTC-2017]|uniref:phage/plasmid replication protein n=1 Tax=Paenibacillus sp. GSMTC-2017 TaxID=2794350 RepID=UPI0018D912E1|nr:phage/plasmid replication protein [Paenibacillus sp. GSMTC-2017]MBH5319869.1 hypothetical protein [Paenibacillus sp. GSMTC-2017]